MTIKKVINSVDLSISASDAVTKSNNSLSSTVDNKTKKRRLRTSECSTNSYTPVSQPENASQPSTLLSSDRGQTNNDNGSPISEPLLTVDKSLKCNKGSDELSKDISGKPDLVG